MRNWIASAISHRWASFSWIYFAQNFEKHEIRIIKIDIDFDAWMVRSDREASTIESNTRRYDVN